MKVFLTGASGFIGGSVAAHLVASGHDVRGLVRDAAKAEGVRALGVTPVIGTLDDAALLTGEASTADAVVNAASSDHRAAVEALLAGLAGSGKAFVHTSGSSIVSDLAMGAPSDRVFDEDTPFTPVPERVARVALDRFILDAPGVRSVVLCNSLIYGRTLGAAGTASVQLPQLVAWARRHGRPGHIGAGLNIWSNVHIADVADLYCRAVEQAAPGVFCFVENGEASFRDMANAIGAALALGEAAPITAEAAIAAWGRGSAVMSMGSNSRVRGQAARTRFGWSPRESDVLGWIRRDLAPPPS